MGRSNLLQAFPNYLICMCFNRINTVRLGEGLIIHKLYMMLYMYLSQLAVTKHYYWMMPSRWLKKLRMIVLAVVFIL